MKPMSRDRESGFALVESIAVLVLSALVLLTLLIAADLVTRNSAAAAVRANEIETLATGLAAFRRDVEGARRVRVASLDGPLLFHGGPTSLGIVAAGDLGPGSGDALIRVATESDGERTLLVRSSAPFLPQTSGFGDATFDDPAVLLAGPWSYRFSYAGATGGWLSSWVEPKEMPRAIRLEVSGRDGAVVPPIVVRLHIDAEAGCPESSDGLCDSEGGGPGADPQNQVDPDEPFGFQ